jgi:hypothetical protein
MPARALIYRFLILPLLALAACNSEPKTGPTPPPAAFGRAVYGLTATNELIVFGSGRPDSIARRVSISGLPAGESLVGIDFGPRDGRLYAVGLAGRILVLDSITGVATQVGSTTFTPAPMGMSFGVDFNPVPNRIRVHSDQAQNLRLNQLTGAVGATDTTLAYAAGDLYQGATPRLVGTAYTVFIGDTTTTTLYAIDSGLDYLVKLPSPNSGRITSVGSLGINTTDDVGFDIVPTAPGTASTAFASLTPVSGAASQLYLVDLMSGTASPIGTIGVSPPLRGMAVQP